MKTKKGFRLRDICGEHIVVAEGIDNIDFSKIISMNESSAYLWEKVQGEKEFTVRDTYRNFRKIDADRATVSARFSSRRTNRVRR